MFRASQSPSRGTRQNCRRSLWFPYECGGGSVLSRGRFFSNRRRLRTLPHSYGNQRLWRQFDGLMMMGVVMPETCWAVSVRQSSKFYDCLLHLVGCSLSDWRCTEPQTLKKKFVLVSQSTVREPRGNIGKATYFMACGRDGRVQWVVKDGNV